MLFPEIVTKLCVKLGVDEFESWLETAPATAFIKIVRH